MRANFIKVDITQGRQLIRNIRDDQRKTLSYSQSGGGGAKLDQADFNCVSWCIKQLRTLEDPNIDIQDRWYHFLVVLPQDATREAESSSDLGSSLNSNNN